MVRELQVHSPSVNVSLRPKDTTGERDRMVAVELEATLIDGLAITSKILIIIEGRA